MRMLGVELGYQVGLVQRMRAEAGNPTGGRASRRSTEGQDGYFLWYANPVALDRTLLDDQCSTLNAA